MTSDPALVKLAALARSEHVVALRQALGLETPLYLVGGSVRDVFLGREGLDIDLASPLLPDQIAKRCEAAGLRVIPTGLEHQTVTVLFESDGHTIELTTFRGAGISTEKRVVSSSEIESDLTLRDFTINAIAFGVHDEQFVDPTGGVHDISKKIIRGVLDPARRFEEDPLRIMRMVRFAASLEFDIDPQTLLAAKEVLPALAAVSVERIREEFNKIMLARVPSTGMRLLEQTGVLAQQFPELQTCVGFEQNRFHKADVFEHTMQVIDFVEPELIARLSALFHDIGKPPSLSVDEETGDRHFYRHETIGADITERLMQRFRYSHAITRAVVEMVNLHMRPTAAGAGGLRRLLRDTGELFPVWRIVKEADAKACKISEEDVDAMLAAFDQAIAEIRKEAEGSPFSKLAIRGTDLLTAGYSEGPIIGKILRALHEQVLDDPSLNEREQLLSRVPAIVAAGLDD